MIKIAFRTLLIFGYFATIVTMLGSLKNLPVLKDVVLLGGGHGHVHTLKSFGMAPVEGVRITLISRDVYTPYSGMLPGFIAGHYSWDECHLDLIKMCSFSNTRFINSEAVGIDTENKLIYCKDNRPPISYDILSIDIGIVPKQSLDFKDIEDAMEIIVPVKPIDTFTKVWYKMKGKIIDLKKDSPTRILIIGGGAGGVELCFAVFESLSIEFQRLGRSSTNLQLVIITRSPSLLQDHNLVIQEMVKELMTEKNIEVHCNKNAITVELKQDASSSSSSSSYHYLVCDDGSRIAFDRAILCTQASPQPWLRSTGLTLNDDGFICVQPTLESLNTPDVFACGDVSHFTANPRPKAGVFAVRAGPVLTENIRRRLSGHPLQDWEPQDQFLGIIGTGNNSAIASKGPIALKGDYIWTLKQHIDKMWMRGYQDLPQRGMEGNEMNSMTAAPSPNLSSSHQSAGEKVLEIVAGESSQTKEELLASFYMRCGACGSKVSAQILNRALRRVRHLIPSNPAVVLGIQGLQQSDDAALIRPPTSGRGNPEADLLMAQTIDFFRAPSFGAGFASDPFVFGKIAAIHSLSDIHAMGATPVSALALCVLPVGPAKQSEDLLVQLLAGACSVFKDEGCALVGGHTSEAAVGDKCPALGFSITGTVPSDSVFMKGPPPPGLALILTKPIGVGVLMVADMNAQAKGSWVKAALSSMLNSNKRASEILGSFKCRFCTDITGFGLAGHLLEMLEGNSDTLLGAELCLDDIPVLPGAVECSRMGLKSSIYDNNSRNRARIENIDSASMESNPLYPLLWDPQTCGGLLAAVPSGQANNIIQSLKQNGYSDAAVIGSIIERKTIQAETLSESSFVDCKQNPFIRLC